MRKEDKWKLAHLFGTIYDVEEALAMMEVLADGAPTCGPKVAKFEQKFAKYIGVKHAIAVNSCASALHLSAIALGIGPGDEVIVPTLTFRASANVFAFQGAKIVFAEPDPHTFNIDPTKIKQKITERTKAIVAVHMCGQPCEMDLINEIAKERKIAVIEDAAHAIGAEYKGRKVGTLGDISAFSFHQCKNMSTLGEGGMVTTNNDEYAEKIKLYRTHGGAHGAGVYIGLNYRMTDVQAAVGIVQLDKIDKHNEIRRKLAHYLTDLLKEIKGIILPYEMKNVKHVYHLYNILIEPDIIGMDRDTFIKRLLDKEGITAITQYFPPVHLLKAYQELGHRQGECPIAEDLTKRIVTLPISPRFTFDDMNFMGESIKRVIKGQ